MSNSEIRTYSLTGTESQSVLGHAKTILRPHLPVSLPIYRRLQFGRFFDATTLLTNIPNGSDAPNDKSWLFAFVDRTCRPETEVWLFASWEVQADVPPEWQTDIDHLVKTAVTAMKNLGTPVSIHQDVLNARAQELETEKDKGGFSRDDYGGHMVDPNIMLWGGIHERTVPILERLGLLTRRFKTGVVPNFTFLWEVDNLPAARALPEGLRWGGLQAHHFALVRSRTQIPRQDRTLAVLPNQAIFPADSDTPVAWTFIGLDASLTSLHVEQEWRGRGLAKAITTKLFQEKMESFWEDGERRLGYGYVIVGNRESEGMCVSLGGKSDWESFWLRVDLGQL